ncbi:Solute carrier family 15 member 1 [Oryzias melastigma]|uniref:Solute carrier family 15 member 1 n=1 Tax=Oryzias melastigma TaxID=30732 RepID=A0A834FQB2_ORYME|nr:Solute carrier family 15 member 1 [Oryzias melastigma]
MAEKEELKKSRKKSPGVCGYPISIFFIVINEFCERFSYYGMRAVLVLYFKYFLRWDDDFATTIYHTFVALCYLTPILGAIIADSWLGKFKTIVYLSIVYTLGQVVLAVSAIHDITDTNRDGTPDNLNLHIALSMVGLLLIALGTGGIKPCVAAFGGDQFDDDQEKQRGTFFSIFYLSINAGSLLSTIITPILRGQECGIYTQQQCYALAFGVPAALMAVALIVFIVGSGMYNKTAPQGNVMVKFCKCIGFAIKNRFRHRSSQYPKREHWMDWADEKYDKLLIAQVKMVLKVLFLYIPLPMFWALFDQQGSRWTLQATTMDGNFGALTIQPDQMQKTLPKFPSTDEMQVKFINVVDRDVQVQAGEYNFPLKPFSASENYETFTDSFTLTLDSSVSTVSLPKGTRNTITISKLQSVYLCLQFEDITEKPEQGANAIRQLSKHFFHRFFNGFGSSLNVTIGDKEIGYIVPNNMSEYGSVPRGSAKYQIKNQAGVECVIPQELGFGSSYTMLILPTFNFGPNCSDGVHQILDIEPNSFSMAWQIPQYFLLTAGEVVFSVTGLEFSYSQAPSNMKSVLQAGWLLTVAFGNIIVLIVAEAATLEDQWAEYILFAALLILVCIIFAIMAYFYTYIDPAKIEAHFANKEHDEKKKRKSLEMVKKDSFQHQDDDKKSSDSSSDEEEESKQSRM